MSKATVEDASLTVRLALIQERVVTANADGVYLYKDNVLLYDIWFTWAEVWNALVKEPDRIRN
jgi:hypothetical protein